MIDYFVNKRKIIILLFSVLFMAGFFNLPFIERQELPDISGTSALITTAYPGAGPEKVEYGVTKIIEEKLNEVSGIGSIVSESRDNVSVVTIETKKYADVSRVWEDVRKRLKEVEAELPNGASQPVFDDSLNKAFIQSFNVTAESFEQLYGKNAQFKSWKDQLRTIRNVSNVTITGLPEKEVVIDLNGAKLTEYGLGWEQVSKAIQAYNTKSPMGDFALNRHTFKLKMEESYETQQLNDILVGQSKDGMPVYLRDVGEAYDGYEEPDYYVYHNGKPAVTFKLTANLGSDVPAIQKEVDKLEASFQNELPPEMKMENIYTKSDYLSELFRTLFREVLIAIAAVLLVCSLGLSFRTSLIIALAIPFSISIALLFSGLFDITLNEVSIYSLIIVIGILVDDAVVVNDNIERHRVVLQRPPKAAAIEGAREVFPSILTATLAAIFSFGVLGCISGEMGQLMRPLPVIVIFAMLASMAMSLAIVPIYRDWHESRNPKSQEAVQELVGLLGKQIKGMGDWYAFRVLPSILRHPKVIGVFALLISMGAYGLIWFSPIQLFPAANRAELLVDIRGVSGDSLENTRDMVAEVSQWVGSQPGVEMVAAYVGGGAPDMFGDDKPIGRGEELGQLIVRLDREKVSAAEVIDFWTSQLKAKYPEAQVTPRELIKGVPVGKAVDVSIYGPDGAQLQELAQQVKEKLRNVQGTTTIQDSMGFNLRTLKLEGDKALMDSRMVNNSTLTSTVLLASNGLTVSQFDDGNDLVNIKMYADKAKTDPLQRVENLSIPNALGQQIPLKQIAQLETVYTSKVIHHRNMSRVIDVTSDLKGRVPLFTAFEVEKLMQEIELPEGYRWEINGEVAEEKDTIAELAGLLLVAVLLIVITVAIQFNSISIPFIILLTFVLAFSGSFIGLFVTQSLLGFTAIMGIISLVGIVARNGIVLIEFIENERHGGTELKEAVIHAVSARIKPVLLTSATAIVGLIPIALSSNVLFRPLAVSIISGLMYSSVLTLVVVPAIYTAIAQFKIKRQNRKALDTLEAKAETA